MPRWELVGTPYCLPSTVSPSRMTSGRAAPGPTLGQVADVGELALVDVGPQRSAGEGLPDVGRVAGEQALGEHDLGVAAAAPGDRAIGHGHVGVAAR